ncbi:sensor histidine kinase [Cohnella cellulosilytica]|uniref:histidine kinase n=1 Tax=Cohnella cellulosilytica TaxID=986710 RepID=A0ABW2FDF9_9BACL
MKWTLRLAAALWLVLLVGEGVAGAAAEKPEAVNGVLDLEGYSFERDGALALNGEWELYWQRLLEPGAFADAAPTGYVRVPGSWKDQKLDGVSLTNQSFATYRLVVRLDPEEAAAPADRPILSMRIPGAASAYKLWINGRQVASVGKVGVDAAEMKPGNNPTIVAFPLEGRELELVLQASNFVQRKGGLWIAPVLGEYEPLLQDGRVRIGYELAICGALLVMAVYHVGFYLSRRKEPSALYFAGVCLMILLRTLSVGESLIYRLLPWQLGVKTEYASVILAALFFLLFVRRLYPRETRAGIVRPAVWTSVALTGLIAAAPALVFTKAMLSIQLFVLALLLYCAWLLVLAAMRGRAGTAANLAGLLVLILCVVNDVVYYNRLFESRDLSPLGIVMFLFVQALNLSRSFSEAFASAERLSEELTGVNARLERQVEERTSELREANGNLVASNRELLQLQESRRQLLTDISHELGHPLTTIQGYVRAMIDGIEPRRRDEHLRIVQDNTQLLNRMFKDLLELAKMETHQIEFRFAVVPLDEYVDRLYRKYEREVAEAGIRFERRRLPVGPGSEASEPAVRLDMYRMEQAFVNLLSNAKKHTPPGGTIRVTTGRAEPSGDSCRAVVRVEDTGSGIEPEHHRHLFERFYKARRAHGEADNSGTGLGLAIVKGIVEAHGGTIEASSVPGEGSAFTITLPTAAYSEDGE